MTDSPHIVTATTANFSALVVEESYRRPVLVDFWAGWCAPCRQLMPLLAKLAEAYRGQFLLAKVDTEAEQALAMQFGIRSLPTVQIFKDGRAVDQFMGALPEAQVRAFLERHIPNEADKSVAAARRLITAGDLDAAQDLLDRAQQDDAASPALFVARAQLLAARGDLAGLADALEHTPVELVDHADIKALRARSLFAQVAAAAPEQSALAARVAQDPDDGEARYQLAARLMLTGEYESALDHLLTLLQKDRRYGEDAARKAILMGFELLGADHPAVPGYRARLSRLLY